MPIRKPLSIILVINNLPTRYFILCCNNTNIHGLSLLGGGFKPHGLSRSVEEPNQLVRLHLNIGNMNVIDAGMAVLGKGTLSFHVYL